MELVSAPAAHIHIMSDASQAVGLWHVQHCIKFIHNKHVPSPQKHLQGVCIGPLLCALPCQHLPVTMMIN